MGLMEVLYWDRGPLEKKTQMSILTNVGCVYPQGEVEEIGVIRKLKVGKGQWRC